jgi:superoxide dismutase
MREERAPYFCAVRVLAYYNVQRRKYEENNWCVVNWLKLNKNSAYRK